MKVSVLPQAWRRSLAARLGAHEIGVVVAVFIGAALILGFGMLADEVVEGDTQRLDQAVLMMFRTAGNPADLIGPPWFEEMVRDVTALGSYAFIIFMVLAALGYLLLIRKSVLAILMVTAVVGGMILSNLLKSLFDRQRPDVVEHAARVFTASFPSGHATLSAVTFLTLGALLTRVNADRKVKLYFMSMAVFLTIIVGVSRVYLGVHYPSDVLAGWCIGSAWAVLCWAGALWLQRRGDVERPSSPSSSPG